VTSLLVIYNAESHKPAYGRRRGGSCATDAAMEVQNRLGEIASDGSGAQAPARANLGWVMRPFSISARLPAR
jgi:hypothetical protein